MKADLNGWYGGVNWGHVAPRHCISCAGYGKIGGHRWRYDPASGAMVHADEIACPRCKGSGKVRAHMESDNGLVVRANNR